MFSLYALAQRAGARGFMRINKYLAECGVCSRRKADELVKQGRVSVNKKVVREVGTDIDEDKDVIFVDGKKVVRVTHYDYLLFYKPKNCVTTLNEDNDNKSGRKKSDKELEEIKNRTEKLAAKGIVEEPVVHANRARLSPILSVTITKTSVCIPSED